MSLRERLRRHSKDTRWIVAGLGLLLVVLSALYFFILRSRELPANLVTNRVLIFGLIYVDVILIFAVFFVLLRNVVKLLIERHHRILGAQFKTKLVATYIGLSLVPVVVLFFFASNLLQNAVDRWFTAPVKQVLEQGNAIAQAMNERIEDTLTRDAGRAARELEPERPGELEPGARLLRRLQELMGELHLDVIAVYSDTELVSGAVNTSAGLSDLPEPGKDFLLEALREGHASKVMRAAAPGRLILAASTGRNRQGPQTLVVAGTLLPPALAEQSERLILAYQGYRQLEVQRGELKASHVLTFLMVTLVVLLASSWTGLYLARRVTVPIQALAEGTRRISQGDLGHRVEAAAGDELGVLVESFNRMTADLERSRDELLNANQRLAEERARIAAVLQNVAAGVLSIDRAGRIFTCNAAALGMLRQSSEEVLGRAPREAWSDPERAKLAQAIAEAEAEGQSREARLTLDGEWKTFEVKVTPLGGGEEEGGAAGKVVVFEDLSELIKAQQLAAWSEAARRIAHEIKNPLTPIRLAAERLQQRSRAGDPRLAETVEEAVEAILREVESMRQMVDEFSRFARMPRPQPRSIDLARLVEDAAHLYRAIKPGVEVRTEIAPGAERAIADPEQLRQVLINLLDNAVEATDAPGEVAVRAAQRDGRLEIQVADTGRGIPRDAKEKLFLPYYSTKGRGSGLGLAIVQRIVSDHHGTIRVEDNAPRGSVFSIELPQS